MDLRTLEQDKLIESEMNKRNSRGATTERWELVSSRTLLSNRTLSTQYSKTLAAGQSSVKNSATFSFGIGYEFESNIAINVGFTEPTTSVSYAGPSFSDKVANTSLVATHSFVVFAMQGSVAEFTYNIYTSTGQLIRTEKHVTVVRAGEYAYNLRANITLNNMVTVENVDRNRTKTFASVNTYIYSFGNGKLDSIFF